MVVVIKNLKELLYGILLSPSLSEPLLSTYFNNIGSRAGSNSSPTFSMSTHLPNCIPNSRFLNNYPSLILKISKPDSASSLPKFLINLFA
jgi:hypothetical protein